MIRLEELEPAKAFEGLSRDQLAVLLPHFEELEHIRGDLVFTEGEPADHLWILLSGDVGLSFRLPDGESVPEDDMIELKGGARAFGFACFAEPRRYIVSARCTSRRCRVGRIRREDLLSLFEADPTLGYRVMFNLVREISTGLEHFVSEVERRRGLHIMTGW